MPLIVMGARRRRRRRRQSISPGLKFFFFWYMMSASYSFDIAFKMEVVIARSTVTRSNVSFVFDCNVMYHKL